MTPARGFWLYQAEDLALAAIAVPGGWPWITGDVVGFGRQKAFGAQWKLVLRCGSEHLHP